MRQYLGRGDAAVAACRSPDGATALHALGREYGDRLRVLACDVGDDDSVAAFAAALEGTAVDLLINNGVDHATQDQIVADLIAKARPGAWVGAERKPA